MKVGSLFKNPDVDVDLQKRELRKACSEFESLFVAQILKNARASILRSEEPDAAMAIYESMFDDAVARTVAEKGIFGIGELLYEELVPLIEKKKDPAKE
ncbi:rod-binding protein [Thermodesulforhabdus norvegica]|uniref:Flagellar protein FlgJ n=1 Tax=Thermodesulforhabdus norvegica TaxID=39841 RepID=A0A1I4R4H4_9BACT|nr:rod-binding protein [Thermodesulforhabdus norvegica]SFM47149.1 flagellar protein FlgJ [Thermodesulforhabdus norvegica]